MKQEREIWVRTGDHIRLDNHTMNTVVIPVPESPVRFSRGTSFFSEGPDEGSRETRVISAIDQKVVNYFSSHATLPEPANLLEVRIEDPALQESKLEVETENGTTEIALIKEGDAWKAEKKILFVYGSGSSGGGDFDGIVIIDITKADEIGFQQKVKFTAGNHERELGIIDFLIRDPADNKYRTVRYGVFKTRTPTFKLVCPRVGPNNIEVILDDGDDATADTVDITRVVDHAQQVTEYSDFPIAVKDTSRRVKGTWEEKGERPRLFHEPPPEGELALFIYGENRIIIRDKTDHTVLFRGHFLLYLDDRETISGRVHEEDIVVIDEAEHPIARDHVLVDFVENCADHDIARYFYALNLRPRGITKEFNLTQTTLPFSKTIEELKSRIDRIKGYQDPIVDDVNFDFLPVQDAASSMALERYADAFRKTDSIPKEFDPGTGRFHDAELHYFHHFYMHTFPAHRLIDKIRFPDEDPPAMILSGAHFDTDKTFVLPSAKDDIQRLFKLKQEHPDRKIAIFGHSDAVGAANYNNELSRRRGQAVHALLTRDHAWWRNRFTRRAGEKRWVTREVQHMLKALGYCQGELERYCGEKTKQALRDFKAAENLPNPRRGTIDNDVRARLVEVYVNSFLDAAMPADSFFQAPGNAPAIFGCGESFPVIHVDQANPRNRRVEFVLRRAAGTDPIDLTQVGANAPYQQWMSQEKDPEAAARETVPPFTVACYDDSFGYSGPPPPPPTPLNTRDPADDYSGDEKDRFNRYMIKGRRLVRPTWIPASGADTNVVYADGDTSHLHGNAKGSHDPPPIGNYKYEFASHGFGVMTCMAGDGIGNEIGNNPRAADKVVLGTGKDIKLRPMKADKPFRAYEVLAADPDVKIVSCSWGVKIVNMLTRNQRKALKERMKSLVESGKIYFRAACNVAGRRYARYRDVGRTEGGFVAPDRNNRRGSYTGDDAFRQRIVTVGATTNVTNRNDPEVPTRFTYLGDELSVAAPGNDIRVLTNLPHPPPASPAAFAMAKLTSADGVALQPVDGTSFSTPMTAGIAAEMMLANPILQAPTHFLELLEMLEATADPLPSLADVPAAGARGPYLRGSSAVGGAYQPGTKNPDRDRKLKNSDLAGFRRVHFWKAVLAAVNNGIPAESLWDPDNHTVFVPGRSDANSAVAATNHFTSLTGRNHAQTTWYGFEVRVKVPRARIWFRRADGTMARVQDRGAALPDDMPFASAWRKTQDLRASGTHANPGYRHYVLPAFPYAGTDWWMCQFSIKREELDDFREVRVYPEDVDPAADASGTLPAICVLDLQEIEQMRDPRTIARPYANRIIEQIATHVEEFDDFVFHVTVKPQPLAAFVFVHPEGVNTAEDTEIKICAVDRFGNIKSDFNGAVTVTPQSVGGGGPPPPVTQAQLDNGASAAAAAVNLTNGSAAFRFTDSHNEQVRLTATGGGKTGTSTVNVANPGPLARLRVEITHWNGADPLTRPPEVAQRLKVTVTALDDQGRTKTDFKEKVALSVAEGKTGFDAPADRNPSDPPKGGVHVADRANQRFDASRFQHTYNVFRDRGKHEFSVFVYTAGPLVLKAAAGETTALSRKIQIKAGDLHHFKLDFPASAQVGNTFSLAVTVKDEYDNTIEDYKGRVELERMAGTAHAIVGNDKRGLFFESTEGAGGDHHTYAVKDKGVHNFPVTAYTAPENIDIKVKSAIGGIEKQTNNIAVQGAGALDRFEFEVDTPQEKGSRFPVTVKAIDTNGKTKTDLAGDVTLALARGTAYIGGAPGDKEGAQITGSPHTFAAADKGRFVFTVRAHTSETLRFRASHGAGGALVSTDSIDVSVRGWENFDIQVGNAQTVGNRFDITVTVQDHAGNTKTDFRGKVDLSLAQGRNYSSNFFGFNRKGTKIHRWSSHTYKARDHGVHVFRATAYEPDTIRFKVKFKSETGTVTAQSVTVAVT